MNEGTLSTAFSPNFATKLCFFVLSENLAHGPLPVQTFLPFVWAILKEYRLQWSSQTAETGGAVHDGSKPTSLVLFSDGVWSIVWLGMWI